MYFQQIWRCCGGEVFVHTPGVGLAHVPFNEDVLSLSIVLPAIAIFAICLGACLLLLICLLGCLIEMRCSLQKKNRLYVLALVPLMTMLLLGPLLTGPIGKWLVREVGGVRSVGVSDLQAHLDWKGVSPFDFYSNDRAKQSRKSKNISAEMQLPRGGFRIWTEDEAAGIVERVMALKQSWTISGLGQGTGMFLLGIKYGFQIHGGTVYSQTGYHSYDMLAERLWSEFNDTFVQLKDWCEDIFGMPARLQRHEHWPPVFIMHYPSAVFCHNESQDIHRDNNLREEQKMILLRSLRSRPGWKNAKCIWESQLSVLVALNLPPGGAGLDYFLLANGMPQLNTIDHQPGRAIIIEAARPHRLRPFSRNHADGLKPRMVLHAFLIACQSSSDSTGQMEVQILGPTPR